MKQETLEAALKYTESTPDNDPVRITSFSQGAKWQQEKIIQEIQITHSEKVEMYQMIEKDKLIEMLIEANNLIKKLTL